MTYLSTPQAGVPTTPIGPIARRWAPSIMFFAVLLTLALIGALASWRPAAQARAEQPIIIVATPTMAGPAVAAAPPRTGLPRAIVAYDAPDGHALGAIEAGRAFTPTLRSGLEWLQIDATGSGLVWVRVADLIDGLASLPDVATPIPAPAIVEAAPRPVEQDVLAMPQPTVDHAACCEKPADAAAERRRQFRAGQ
jgi:hypothetical protein